MGNKKRIAFIPLIFACGLILSACNNTPAPEKYTITWMNYDGTVLEVDEEVEKDVVPTYDGATPTKASDAQFSYTFVGWSPEVAAATQDVTYVAYFSSTTNKYTVTWKNSDGTVLETDANVPYGTVPSYDGAAPTKAGDEESPLYRFLGWDKKIEAIKGDTVFTAVYQNYLKELVVEDFENIADNASLKEAGWVALGYDNTSKTWTEETAATVSLGSRSEEGKKSARFDAWENGVGYKIAGPINKAAFTGSVNALKFRLMIPSINTVKVILHMEAVEISGQSVVPTFTYTLAVKSSEYVEYTIPLNDAKWDLWGLGEGKSIVTAAEMVGLHVDDIAAHLTKIEFFAQGNDGNGWPYVAFLDSVKFVTIPEVEFAEKETINQYNRYTGKTASGNIVRLDIGEAGAATAKVLDLATPVTVEGKVEISGKEITFTSNDEGATLVYKGELENAAKSVKFVSADGALKTTIGEMGLVAVQVVNNFEQYDKDGQAYCQKYSDKEARSGMRGDFYSEYYSGSGSAPWGGNNWSLLGGEGDQAKLKTGEDAHGGTKYGCFKNSAGVAMRYMQWGLFDGTSEQNSFRGSKLSFWIKTKDRVPSIVVRMYSTNKPTLAKIDERVKKITIKNSATVKDWTHYELELNPKLIYYGFMISLEKNQLQDSYLYVDDIEVYGENPYATYVAPETPKALELKQSAYYVAQINGLINCMISIGSEDNATIQVPGLSLSASGKYAIENDVVTFTFTSVGLIYKATLSKDVKTLTFKEVSGEGAYNNYFKNLNFQALDMADKNAPYSADGKMYYQSNKDDTNVSGARGAYYCEYYSNNASNSSPIGGSKWTLMGGEGNQVQLNKTTSINGISSIKMKFSTAGAMRYIQWGLFNGTAEAHKNVNKFAIYLMNPNAYEVNNIKIRVYSVQQINQGNVNSASAYVEKVFKLDASQSWTQFVIDLDASKTYYGYSILLDYKANTGFINTDFAYFYNEDTNPMLSFYAPKDLELKGTITAGEASLKFAGNGKALLTIAALQMENKEVSYEMSMAYPDQKMVISVLVAADTYAKITGTYSINAVGIVTFKVTEVDDALSTAVNVGAKLTFTPAGLQ